MMCIIPICNGTVTMNGPKYIEFLDKAAREFTGAHVILCDTLDVHNFITPDMRWFEAADIAKNLGDRWLRKHLRYIENRFTEITLDRWNDVLADPNYREKFRTIDKLYHSNAEIRQWIEDNARKFARIKADRLGHGASFNNLYKKSIDYLLEEIAGTAVYAEWYDGPAVYPDDFFRDPYFFNRHPAVSLILPKLWQPQETEVAA